VCAVSRAGNLWFASPTRARCFRVGRVIQTSQGWAVQRHGYQETLYDGLASKGEAMKLLHAVANMWRQVTVRTRRGLVVVNVEWLRGPEPW